MESKRNTHQDEPCGSQGPKQTQQNSALQFWFLQTMWLQPPSFSIVTLHFGHSWKGWRDKIRYYVTHNGSTYIWDLQYLRVGGNPVGCFRIIITLFYPLLQDITLYWVMPVFPTGEAKYMSTFAVDWPAFLVLHLYDIVTIWRRAPSQKSVALNKEKKRKGWFKLSIFHRNGSSSRTFIFTSTKLLVIRCWYLRRTFESLTSLMTVTSSTRISQPWAAQAIVWPTPSSIILVVR